jgi:archaellum component FlaC
MSNNEIDNSYEKPIETPPERSGMIPALVVGLVLSLAGNVYLLVRSNQINDDLAQLKDSTHTQITQLGENTTSMVEQRLQTLNDTMSSAMKGASETASSAVKQARAEIKKQGAQLSDRLDEHQKQFSDEITQLKDVTTSASSKINEVSTDVDGVKTDVNGVKTEVSSVKANVASTQTEVEKHGNDLKRVLGDMGVMSGLIATNSKDLGYLRELGERNYIEFDLTKRDVPTKVGDVTLTLKKTDPKRNRFTVEALADDKRVEKRDQTINEPVQLYISG